MGTTLYLLYLIESMQLNIYNGKGVFVWNDVDLLFIINFDLYLKLIFAQCYKRQELFQHHSMDGHHFILVISMLDTFE